MLPFVTKRLIYILVTIPVLLLLFLGLFRISPVDSVQQMIDAGDFQMDAASYRNTYQRTAEKYDLNQPLFYWSIGTRQWNSKYFEIALNTEKEFYQRITQGGIVYSDVFGLYEKMLGFEPKGDSLSDEVLKGVKTLKVLLLDASLDDLESHVATMLTNFDWGNEEEQLNEISQQIEVAKVNAKPFRSWLPKLYWHGSRNQFHTALKQTVRDDFGVSLRDGREVGDKIWQAFFLTLFLIVLAAIAIFPLGIWLGKRMSYLDRKWLKWIERVLLFFASIPMFWLATLLLVFFTTPEYGEAFHIFSSISSYGFRLDDGIIEAIVRNGKQLILPMLCFLLSDLAIVMRQTHQLYKNEKGKPYILTARMKGLLAKERSNKHISLNARPQLLTMISSGVASAFAGSLVIEYIFNIPGVGRLLLDSIRYGDRPVLIGIVILLFLTSSLIFLLADVLYRYFDPRLKQAT